MVGIQQCMHSRACTQKRLCEVEFVHEVVHAGADSGFDWLHWPRYVATGAQGSMDAALARQPAEVVHTARHEDVCAQQEKSPTKPSTQDLRRAAQATKHSTQPASRCNALGAPEPKVLSWAMEQSDEMRKTDHAKIIRTCQQYS